MTITHVMPLKLSSAYRYAVDKYQGYARYAGDEIAIPSLFPDLQST